MKADKYLSFLKQFNLSDNEALAYTTLLSNGGKVATELAQLIGLTRTNTYQVLQRLLDKQLVTKLQSGNTTSFHAAHPEALNYLLSQQQAQLTTTQNQLEAILPDLISTYALAEEQPGVFRFEGKQGMVRAYEELLKDRLPLRSIQNRQTLRAFIADYNPVFVARRVQLKLPHRIISVEPKHKITSSRQDKDDLREVRYVNETDLPWNMDLKITQKKIVMTTFKKESAVGIIIVDPEVTKNYQFLFEFFWSMLGK